MKIYRPDSPIEKKLQQVENLLTKLKLSIEWDGYRLNVIDSEYLAKGYIHDTESRDDSTSLPRGFESERIVFDD